MVSLSLGLVVITGLSWPQHINFFWLVHHPSIRTWWTTANRGCSHSHTMLWSPMHSWKNWARAGQNSSCATSTKCLKNLLAGQKDVSRVTKIHILWKLGLIYFQYRQTNRALLAATVHKGKKKKTIQIVNIIYFRWNIMLFSLVYIYRLTLISLLQFTSLINFHCKNN